MAVGLFASAPAAANTFTPTRLDDPPPGKCKPDDCSLREAIRAANNQNGRDEVVLRAGTYELEILPADGDPNEDGQTVVSDPLTIRGQGPGATRIDANGIDRVLAAGATAKLQGLTVKGGDAGGSLSHANEGGGILNSSGKLTLANVVITQNEANVGGGLRARGDNLTLRNVVIRKNEAQFGGGLQSIGPKLTIKDSTIAQNNAGVAASTFPPPLSRRSP